MEISQVMVSMHGQLHSKKLIVSKLVAKFQNDNIYVHCYG